MAAQRIAYAIAITVAPILLDAQAPVQAPARMQHETFTGMTVNLTPGAGESLRIDVFRWATDAERDALLAVFKDKGDSGVSAALEKAPTAGYVWGSGPLGYALKYAQKVRLPGGAERIILVTDRALGSWSREPWKPSGRAAVTAYPFTLVELRLDGKGRGVGKMSLAAKVTADGETVSLADFAAAPVLLDDVRRASPAGSPSSSSAMRPAALVRRTHDATAGF